ncbi:HAD family phosphatase [Rhodoferax saidenbachensis]|uniref:HAD superfamily hydrolase (TIGR01509 family) n=1 Tax=Rhodoferax saidenbachensis TaxID=1484693 RepID=A0ABU1ZJ63_9BURK|nr:HAD family phosphatase [Rhodoferax saidenbachensis]MDR7305589.1 HAD superfamily hydrolase (TIGR01509 family) [Rhodoferax saidenbachensis]
MRFKAVLFDHDGTLVESEGQHFALWNQVLAPYGFALTLAQYKDFYAGVPTDANAADLVERFGVKEVPEVLARLKNESAQAYLQAHAFPLMPGVRESVARLQAADLRLGVVTGARGYAIDATLRSHDLAPAFETVVSADDVVHSKPAPDCYLLALQRMGLPAQAVVAFEDTEHGVAAAVAAGLACVAIPTEMSATHDFSAATVTLPCMQDAVRWALAQP